MKLVVANWKMKPETLAEAKRLVAASVRAAHAARGVEVVLCPPFPFLGGLPKRRSAPWFGAQDVFWESGSGAYTGEVSVSMLKDVGCRYVIVGHSERKRHLGETDGMIQKKVRAALSAGLKAVLCVGESTREEDTRSNVVDRAIETQLFKALEGVPSAFLKDLIVTYEPVWAISTTEGARAATPDDALQAALLIRKLIGRTFGRAAAEKLKVLYGGSVDRKTVTPFIREREIDGVLVGAASADQKEFAALLKAF